jgi:anti-sigma regulatory factor (Ser/Thr protein kinase)
MRPSSAINGGARAYAVDATGASAPVAEAPRPGFRHEALLYSGGETGFSASALPRVRRALMQQAPVLVAAGTERVSALRESLGTAAEGVRFEDVRAIARNPARVIPLLRGFMPGRVLAGSGEALAIVEPVWRGRSPAELSECERHEALVNLAFGDGPAWQMLCAYDVDALEDAVVESAMRTHPLLVWDGEGAQASQRYAYGQNAVSQLTGSLPTPASSVQEMAFTASELAQLRHTTGAWAHEHGLGTSAAEELVLAVNEIAANSIRHGGGTGTLRRWREDGSLVCEVADAGVIDDQLVGRSQPAAAAESGRGVWMANQLCDLVQIRSGPAGSVVRVHKSL